MRMDVEPGEGSAILPPLEVTVLPPPRPVSPSLSQPGAVMARGPSTASLSPWVSDALLSRASASPAPFFAPRGRLGASTRHAKPLLSLHGVAGGSGPLLKGTCRVHGEPLSVAVDRKEGEVENRRERLGERVNGLVGANGRGQGEEDREGCATVWLYRCGRGCSLTISSST